MYIILHFSFNRFKILQGSSTGYEDYGLCFFDDRISFQFFGTFYLKNDIIYINCNASASVALKL